MKYYYVCSKKKDEQNKKKSYTKEYEYYTLCRIQDNICESYEMGNRKSSGQWVKNKELHEIIKKENKDYIIKQPTKKEIEANIMYIDDLSYEDMHISTNYSGGCRDDKGKRHDEFIYQDYRSIDGYCVDGGFEADIILNRKYNDYYLDEANDILIKIDKDTKEIYIYQVNVVNNWIENDWIEINKLDNKIKKKVKKYDFKKMKTSTDYDKIITYTYNKASEEAKKGGIDHYW